MEHHHKITINILSTFIARHSIYRKLCKLFVLSFEQPAVILVEKDAIKYIKLHRHSLNRIKQLLYCMTAHFNKKIGQSWGQITFQRIVIVTKNNTFL